FDAFGDIVRKCRRDLGAEIDISLGPLSPSNGVAARHCQTGTIRYADGETAMLLYLRPTITSDEPTDLFQYARSHPRFPGSADPERSTRRQFIYDLEGLNLVPHREAYHKLDEAEDESYRLLGQHIIESLADEVSSSADWRTRPVNEILRDIR